MVKSPMELAEYASLSGAEQISQKIASAYSVVQATDLIVIDVGMESLDLLEASGDKSALSARAVMSSAIYAASEDDSPKVVSTDGRTKREAVFGTVVWFDANKGYGFIDADDGRAQIFFRLKQHDFPENFPVKVNSRMCFVVVDRPDGKVEAVDLRQVMDPDSADPSTANRTHDTNPFDALRRLNDPRKNKGKS